MEGEKGEKLAEGERRDFVRDGDKRSANTAMRRRARSVALGCAGLNIGHGGGERESGGGEVRNESERKT